MNLLTIEGISKSFSERQLIDNISFSINEGDKIGLIGVNGTGKSTLLRIIGGEEMPDSGRLIKGNTVSVEYLSQNPYFDPQATVLEQIYRGNSDVMKLIREYYGAVNNKNTANKRIIELTHKMDETNAWSIESEAKAVLTKLGILDFSAMVNSLSVGQKKRIALAAALVNPSELLILDEPTNHLDSDTIDWLEQYLNKRKGAVLMVTHDRYFLDGVVNHIIELDKGNLYVYKGNYNSFIEKRIERKEMEVSSESKRQNLFRKELAWIRRGAKARSTKQKARIDRFEELKNQKVDLSQEKVDISVGTSRLGKKIIEIKDVSKIYGNKQVVMPFSYTVLRNDRVGIVGANGTGKSTLMNIICGRLKPDTGEVDIGDTVKLGFYSQENYSMNNELKVIEYIREGAEYLTTANGDKITASQMLEKFLFPTSEQWTKIEKLSGGEKRRLYLLRVLMEAPNVLLLDEPTNDLDTETLTILEDYLEAFQGVVIAVSHDRYFLDKLAEKIFVFKGNGVIKQYTGNYGDYREEEKEQLKSENTDKQEKKNSKSYREGSKPRPPKFSFKEQKEFEGIDEVIAKLEEDIDIVEIKINEVSADYTLLQELLGNKQELEKQLREKMERWVYLNELAEQISSLN